MSTALVAWVSGDIVGGRYKLDELIGEGGMGVVWSAVQLVTRRRVALKALRDLYVTDKAVRQRFLREARAACAVRHPNVVEIHDVIELADGLPVMVMDLLEGESLGQRIAREPQLPMNELVAIMLPVLSAVSTAHRLGIVHRDLKPDNVFLSRTAAGVEVKVLDFGIAKMTATEGDTAATGALTGTGAMLGTPLYMAPEQIYGDKDVDFRADVWAMGVMFYECFAGVRPTQADSIGQVLKIITRDGITPLRKLRPNLPSDVLDLVDRMLSVDKGKRPSSLGEVTEILERHTNGAAIADTAPPVNTIAGLGDSDEIGRAATLQITPPPSVRVTAPPATTTTVGTRTPKRSAVIGIAVAALGVAAIAGATAFYGSKSHPPTDTPVALEMPRADPTQTTSIAPPPPVDTVSIAIAPASSTIAASAPSTTTRAQAQARKTPHDPSAKPTTSAAPPPAQAATRTPGGVVESAPF